MASKVYAEIGEGGKRIDIYFPFNHGDVYLVKEIVGRRFVPSTKTWTVPLDMETCRTLRQQFGKRLVIGDELKVWATRAVAKEQQLGKISNATDATLDRLPTALPSLFNTLHGFQRSGAKFIAMSDACLVADQPGLGKTLETIAGLYEADVVKGANLVVAPITALDTVWGYELAKWQPARVLVATGSKKQREAVVAQAAELYEAGDTFWLVVNPGMVQWGRTIDQQTGENVYVSRFPFIHSATWTNIVVDECHKGAVRNPQTITAKALYALKLGAGKKVALSGTPMTNRAIDLYGTLRYLDPVTYSSKWQWAERWCVIEDNGFGKRIGGIREDRKAEFFRSLTPIVLRRTKAEVFKELPPKQYVDVWVEMDGKQKKQYEAMSQEAEVNIEEKKLTATGVLAEYTRLKQFANAYHVWDGDNLVPTKESCKLEALLERLDERGILDGEGTEKVVVFSQFSSIVDMVERELLARGVAVAKITGAVNKPGERTRLQREFQADGGPRVMVMTTSAGGVAITLDKADTVFFLDETWSPADMEQAEDRVHRASRIHNVTIYNFRTKGSIEEEIMETVADKALLHKEILDVRRLMLHRRQAARDAAKRTKKQR